MVHVVITFAALSTPGTRQWLTPLTLGKWNTPWCAIQVDRLIPGLLFIVELHRQIIVMRWKRRCYAAANLVILWPRPGGIIWWEISARSRGHVVWTCTSIAYSSIFPHHRKCVDNILVWVLRKYACKLTCRPCCDLDIERYKSMYCASIERISELHIQFIEIETKAVKAYWSLEWHQIIVCKW